MRRQSVLWIAACCLLVAGWVSSAAATILLPAVISNNMVLQRGQPVPIWGWATPGEEITVSIAGQTHTAKAGDDCRWKVMLDKLEVGEPLQMTIKGSTDFNPVIVTGILVGEVWICSGQSNMEMAVTSSKDAPQEIAAANYPNIHLFRVGNKMSPKPETDCTGNWSACSPETVPGYSAAAYFFGRHLFKELNVPIGLIHTSWGGTPAEFWTSRETLDANPTLKGMAGQGQSSSLYNGMIVPLIPYGIRGAIWYQGESNVCRAYQYRTLFPAMVANWRAVWGQGDFPFGYVQIAPFSYADAFGDFPTSCAELWEAQLMSLKSIPNSGMASAVDLVEVDKIHPINKDYSGIHPLNKQEVGRRLGLWAMAKVYGRDLVYSGPIYKSMAVEGNKIRLQFDHVGSGLAASDGKPLTEFTIAGEDQKFMPAVAVIDGNSVVVSSDQVSQPASVRFAWREDALPNLANKEGLPASPFRTDTWKGVTVDR